ncbi:MAG: diguanylate cyclase [bacterium]|nr:diguanylate cyclase [bacterium]
MDTKIFEELKSTGNLPTPAGVGLKILQITESEDFEVAEMSQVIMSDSSLAGRILQLANSTTFGAQQPATTVDESIMRLGSSTVRNLSLAFSLVSARSSSTCEAFDYSGYWSSSLARAVVARALAGKMGVGRPEEAYICGLLSNIGRLALASVFPDEYAEVIGRHLELPGRSLKEIERERFDIDHIQVVGCMATDWKLPEAFCESIRQSLEQKQISSDESAECTLTDVLRLADAIAHAITLDESAPAGCWASTAEQFATAGKLLGSSDFDFATFCDACIAEWVAWAREFQIATQPGRSAKSLEILINQMRQKISNAGSAADSALLDSGPEPSSQQLLGLSASNETTNFSPSTIRILLVDDEPVSLRILQMQLQQKGYEVFTATSGRDGLKLAMELCPDIVAADWQMPEMDGLELCRSLRRSTVGRNMYFLLVTGSGDENIIVEAFDAGVDDFVTKPFLPQVMGARIKGGERHVRLNRKVESDKRIMRRQVAELGVLARKLTATSLTDVLTGLPNRRYALKRLESEWSSLEREGGDLTLLMLDIDHFKSVNDTFGHDVGDIVLRETADIIKDVVRAGDEVCRIGGEEFIVICKNSSVKDCAHLAERLLVCVGAQSMPVKGFDRELTVSIGIAGHNPRVSSVVQLLKFADLALYAAKHGGRNRFVCYSDIAADGEAA